MTDQPSLSFVVLVGSLRHGSLHAAVAATLAGLAPPDTSIHVLGSVGDIPHYNADTQAEGFPPAVMEMAAAIRAASGVIVVTPEYNYSVPGALKNALDWLSRVPEAPFANKPVSLMSGSPGPIGGARVQYHLRQVMVFLDALVFNKPEVMIGGMAAKVDGAAGTITDETTRTFIAGHLAAFAKFTRQVS